jgi:hypothetical protein
LITLNLYTTYNKFNKKLIKKFMYSFVRLNISYLRFLLQQGLKLVTVLRNGTGIK